MSKKRIWPIGSLVIGLAFGLVLIITHMLVKPPAPPAELEGVLRKELRPIQTFALQTHDRGPLEAKNLRGKWSFVFFGYLSCPDVCPNTLHELNSFYRLLADESGAEPEDLQIIFVSVDPARDSTDNLARYVRHFNRRFIGATAGKGAIDRITRQFGASYLIEDETAPGQYLVAHTSAIFLVDPYGRLVASFSQPHYASTLVSQYKKITEYFASAG
ncbi:MAG: SCO family protein [Gammaproteobacteria bacterium]|nr:MAG: SCO family protein [Gammaproteobacteria bacterium]